MSCQWQMGLLAMRSCDAPATAACAVCGRALCMMHMSMGQMGPACPSCASRDASYPKNEDTELASSRDEYYQPYGGAAAFGQQGFFSGADSAAMNQPPLIPQRRRTEEDYDAMET